MDLEHVETTLASLPALAEVDDAVKAYIAAIVVESGASSASQLQAAVGELLESSGAAEGTDGVLAVCASIAAALGGAGGSVPKAKKGGGGRRGNRRQRRRGKGASDATPTPSDDGNGVGNTSPDAVAAPGDSPVPDEEEAETPSGGGRRGRRRAGMSRREKAKQSRQKAAEAPVGDGLVGTGFDEEAAATAQAAAAAAAAAAQKGEEDDDLVVLDASMRLGESFSLHVSLKKAAEEASKREEAEAARQAAAEAEDGDGAAASAGGGGSVMDALWGRERNAWLQSNAMLAGKSMTKKEKAQLEKRYQRYERKEKLQEVREMRRQAVVEGRDPSAIKLTADNKIVTGIPMSADQAAAVASGGGSSAVTMVQAEDPDEGLSGIGDIHLTNVTVSAGGNTLIENSEMRIVRGRTHALIGLNGTGKTTLLRALANREVRGLPRWARFLLVHQETSGSTSTVLEMVMGADALRTRLMQQETELISKMEQDEAAREAKKAEEAAGVAPTDEAAAAGAGGGDDEEGDDAKRLAAIAERLEQINAYSAEARAAEVLAGLGFSTEMQSMPTLELSGGWRMRVAIACALFVASSDPNVVLCLDEPTNHLDFAAVSWLEDRLTALENTCIVVSHDRSFLNTVATDTIHLHNHRLDYYRGNYDTFEKVRAEQRKQQLRAAESVERRRAHMQKFVDKFRANAKRASLAQSRLKALKRLETIDIDPDDPMLNFEFPDPGEDGGGDASISMSQVSFGYDPARPLFRNVDLNVTTNSRIAILGPNGVGKSTLLKLLMSEIEPIEGQCRVSGHLRVAYFTQHHVDGLDLSRTALEFFNYVFPGVEERAARSQLSRFGVDAELAGRRMLTLSGGQKSRVAFALISFRRPHILLLDEVTNHLDLQIIDSLIVALSSFAGGVLMVSHDQHFVESVADELLVVGRGRVSKFAGDLAAYKKVAEREKPIEQKRRAGAGDDWA